MTMNLKSILFTL